MVQFLPDIRSDAFVRRPGNKTGISSNPGISGNIGISSDATQSNGRGNTAFRGGPFSGASSVELSDGARSALYGSERALELARDFNAARLGRPARRKVGEFYEAFGRDFRAAARDLDKVARRIERLTQDLDRRFGDLADRIFGRLDSGLSGGFRSSEFSLSQVNFSLTVESTLLSVVKDGEQSLLRLDKVELSLEAVQIDGSVSIRDRAGFAPKTPLFELPQGLSANEIVDRLIAAFGKTSVTASLEAQEIQLDLSTTVFSATAAEAAASPDQPVPDRPVPDENESEDGIDITA